jgi:hypothetical protein
MTYVVSDLAQTMKAEYARYSYRSNSYALLPVAAGLVLTEAGGGAAAGFWTWLVGSGAAATAGAWAGRNWDRISAVLNVNGADSPAVPKPTPEAPYPNNPDNSDFDRINGGKGARQNPKDGSVWERDQSQHGSRDGDGDQWKRWPDKRSWDRGEKPNSIWPDGRVRK